MKIWRLFMSPMDRDLGYLWDMHDAASQVKGFSEGKTFEDIVRIKCCVWL